MSGGDFKSLVVYQKAYKQAMEIMELSRLFPREEKYSLTDQIRRSSRSVCANLAEAYRRRRYPLHFLSKLADSDAENAETGVWLDFALSCNYINKDQHIQLSMLNAEVGSLLGYMIKFPLKFGGK